MTVKDYSTVQRQLGFIEGIVCNSESYVYDGVIGAIETITEIIEKDVAKEME